MTLPYLKIDAHELPDAQTHVRRTARELAQLTGRYSAITAARLTVRPCSAETFEAHLELLLPQHQIILNATGSTAQSAVRDVLGRALAQLNALERRDPLVRPRAEAKAA